MSDFLSDLGKGAANAGVTGVINTGLGLLGNSIANKQARDNYKWQYDNYLSPSAQVKGLTKAGLNPASVYGNQAPVINSGGLSPVANPIGGIGTSSLADISSYIIAKSQAKKSGAEIKNLDIEAQAKQFELDLSKVFSAPEKFAALTLAWKNVRLADDEHSIKEWQKEKEHALSQTQGIQRDTLQKILDNMDNQIKQENEQRAENINLTKAKQKTESTMQEANKASARASNAAADLSGSQKKYQDIVNDIKDSGKSFELENIIKKWKSENKLNDYQYEQAKFWLRRMSKLNKQLDGDDLKSKISRELDDFFWYWKDEVPSIDLPAFMIPLK